MNCTLPLAALGGLAFFCCGRTLEPSFLRDVDVPFSPREEDAARLEQGWLPLMVLKDGRPCADALTLVEPLPRGVGYLRQGIAETGERERVLRPEDAGVAKTDERGIAWWRPNESETAWRLLASQGERACSLPVGRGMIEDLRMASEAGLTRWALQLLPIRETRVRVGPPAGAKPTDIPMFLLTPDGRVLDRLEWAGEDSVTGWDIPNHPMVDDDEDLRVLAGFDRAQVQPIRDSRTGALTFDLSQCGTVEVELLGADGAPVREPRAVFLQDTLTEPWSGMSESLANAPSVVARDGRAVLHGVPAGKRWRISAFLLGDTACVTTEADGPRRAGDSVSVQLAAAEASAPFAGRLLEPDGAPAGGLDCSFRAGAGRYLPFRTDADGRFAIRVPSWLLDADEEWRVECQRWPTRPMCAVRIPARAIPSAGEGEEWRWEEETPLAMGRVTDESGVGVGWATIWVPSQGYSEFADGEGFFLLESDGSESREAELSLEASSRWHMEEERTFEPGQRDIRFTLRQGARIAGRRASSSLESSLGWKYLLPGDEAVHSGDFMHNWVGLRGGFDIGPIPAEAAEVRVTFSGAANEPRTAFLTGLRLEAGKALRLSEPVQTDK